MVIVLCIYALVMERALEAYIGGDIILRKTSCAQSSPRVSILPVVHNPFSAVATDVQLFQICILHAGEIERLE
jgi:hypothetical protein